MDSIDPELRGSDDGGQPEAQTTVAPNEESIEAFAYSDAQNTLDTNGVNTNGSDQVSQQVSHSLAAEGLPYFTGPIADLNAPQTYQPVTFTTHEPRRRPRSCESCRGLKVKCEPTAEGPCKRCTKAGRECLYTESSGRRKKKQDNKVAELEKKVSGLTAALLAQRGAEASDSMVFDESSVLHSDIPDGDGTGLNGKRRRSEYEQGYDASPVRAAKHRALSLGPDAEGHVIDSRTFYSLIKEPIIHDFCKSLKSLDSWFKQNLSASNIDSLKDSHKSKTNGQENTKSGAKTAATVEAKSTTKKNAPTAPMGRTPLDLLSQVASNEKPSASSPNQNEWYSPYANVNQDSSGYYSQKNKEGTESKGIPDTQDLEQLLSTVFGSRGNLVMSFLSSFLTDGSVSNIKNGDNGSS